MLKLAEEWDARSGVTTPLDADEDRAYTAQKPYKNGVVVYTDSRWAGNGFGQYVTKVAVREGEIVGVYESQGWPSRMAAYVVGVGEIRPDTEWMLISGRRELRTTKTAFHKWIAAVKALRS